MKNDDIEDMLQRMNIPQPEKIVAHPELKIPLLSYKRSSRAGLWLLVLPLTVAIAAVLRMSLHFQSAPLQQIRRFFAGIDEHPVLTYLIPLLFVGLPLLAFVLNLLAICHFQKNSSAKELIVTIKYRPFNILLLLLSLALLVFFFLPDNLSFR
ncbi:MAG: hypothetical protein EOO15_06795 [Chitinophagaceae bacterium]|nr:MAG: hypothetical protein EOO15_06795 [Chitinophagaceae bacterium]